MKLEKTHTAGLLLLAAAAMTMVGVASPAAGVSASPAVALAALIAPLPNDGAIGPSGGCEHNAGPNGRGDVTASGGAVGGGGTEGTTGLVSDEGCPSSMSTVRGARGPAGPSLDSSTTGPDSRPPSGMG
jgi:hypothetical protein